MYHRLLIVFINVFCIPVLIQAEMGCVREEANSIVKGAKPDEEIILEAPHMCIASCILARSLPCSVAEFIRNTENEKGTCRLYKKAANQILVVPRQFSPSGGMASVFHYLNDCPEVNRTQAALTTGRRVAVVEGRTGYGAPVQVYSSGWGPWSAWSQCVTTQSCGRTWSVQNRIRICSVCGTNRAIEVESRPCDCCGPPAPVPTPIQPMWLSWGPWSACPVSCGTGLVTRHRECQVPGQCLGPYDETSECIKGPCPEWQPWQAWGACTATCGTGTRERIRQCFGGQCMGPARESEPCADLPPCCTQWSPWGPCSATCGDGTQTRTRECGGAAADAYNAELLETRPCSSGQPCAYWLPWSDWAPCSASCGPGTAVRQRECHGGQPGIDCPGSAEETKDCSSGPCPEWAPWGEWTPCSVTCGTGERTRRRECLSGANCVGESFQSKPCIMCNCPTWSEWNPYDECNPETGTQTRNRYCCGGCDCDPSGCPGADQETIQCEVQVNVVPGAGDHGPYLPAPPGQEYESGPIQERPGGYRPGSIGPRPYEPGAEIPRPPPLDSYSLKKSSIDAKWEEWSSCSVTCGAGTQSRKQVCDKGRSCSPKIETQKCENLPCDGYGDKKYRGFYLSRRRDRKA